jgi:lipoprotein NlpD
MLMYFYRLVPMAYLVYGMAFVLAGCTQPANYAPVTHANQPQQQESAVEVKAQAETVQDQKPVINQSASVISAEKSEKKQLDNYHVVKSGETLYSIGVSSGQGYQRLAQWNQLAPPYRLIPGQKIRLIKPIISHFASSASSSAAVAGKGQSPPSDKKANLIAKANKLAINPGLPGQKPLETVEPVDNKQEKKSNISTDNKKVLKLNFVWPIKGKISRDFKLPINKGIDITGKIGQKVLAAEAGKIAYSGQGLVGFGNLIIIKHNDLFLSAYGNNSKLMVKEGEQVEKGQIIAQVGNALAKKPALHFEIRKNGKPVNPLKFLPTK